MRIAITGIGPLNPSACGRRELTALLARETGLDPARGGTLTLRGPLPTGTSAQLRQMDTLGRFAVAAAKLAVEDAGLVFSTSEAERVGLALGTGYGCLGANLDYLEGIQVHGTRYGNPIVFQNTVPNAATGYVSIELGIRGPSATFSSGQGAAAEALAFGCDQIEEGRVHTIVVGGADHLSRAVLEVLRLRGVLSGRVVGRPHDRSGDGIVASEGACFLVLEEGPRARDRGVTVHAEIVGTGQAGGDTPAAALEAAIGSALAQGELGPEEIDLVVSSASGSPAADGSEAEALRAVLGGIVRRVAITCPKSWLGETLGSGPAFGVAAAALALGAGNALARKRDEAPELEWLGVGAGDAGPRSAPRVALVPVVGDGETAHAIVLARAEA